MEDGGAVVTSLLEGPGFEPAFPCEIGSPCRVFVVNILDLLV